MREREIEGGRKERKRDKEREKEREGGKKEKRERKWERWRNRTKRKNFKYIKCIYFNSMISKKWIGTQWSEKAKKNYTQYYVTCTYIDMDKYRL